MGKLDDYLWGTGDSEQKSRDKHFAVGVLVGAAIAIMWMNIL